jgi:GDP-L-fucose synthase
MTETNEAANAATATNGDSSESSEAVVMVTGGSGLVGAAISEYIKESGARPGESWVFLSSKDGDLRKREDTEKIFEKFKPTHVIHLAAKVNSFVKTFSSTITLWNARAFTMSKSW